MRPTFILRSFYVFGAALCLALPVTTARLDAQALLAAKTLVAPETHVPLRADRAAQTRTGLAVPVSAPISSPSSPPPSSFHDARFKVSIDIPAGWSLATKDHLVSTFRLDARSAPSGTQLRAVANIAFNPFPDSTFSGAFVYFSVTPHATDDTCARQANLTHSLPAGSAPGLAFTHKPPVSTVNIDGLNFSHAHDQHGNICVQARDDVYTAYRKGACYRFDLAMNNFCGGEVSGVRDMTDKEIEDIRGRMESILTTVQFTEK